MVTMERGHSVEGSFSRKFSSVHIVREFCRLKSFAILSKNLPFWKKTIPYREIMHSECSKFHPNRLTCDRVIAEGVNTVQTRHKMFPILGEASFSPSKYLYQLLFCSWPSDITTSTCSSVQLTAKTIAKTNWSHEPMSTLTLLAGGQEDIRTVKSLWHLSSEALFWNKWSMTYRDSPGQRQC